MKNLNLEKVDITNIAITAASSLINLNNRIFTVCDDQYGLYELKNDGHWFYHQNPLSPLLPKDPKQLKAIKPDYEALMASESENNILLIPSGSRPDRTNVLSFNLLTNKFESLNFEIFYRMLAKNIPLINIEGAAKFQEKYLFLNRGIMDTRTSILSVNANTLEMEKIIELDFGSLENVYLHGSELCIHDNYLYILAVAEDASNSYDDGIIKGSSLFKVSLLDFSILDRWSFNLPIKAEGLCRWKDKWLICTDPDGQGISQFYCFSI